MPEQTGSEVKTKKRKVRKHEVNNVHQARRRGDWVHRDSPSRNIARSTAAEAARAEREKAAEAARAKREELAKMPNQQAA